MTDRRFRRLQLASCSVASLFVASTFTSAPAWAQAECGVPTGTATTATVTCDASGNPYPDGVTYVLPGALTLTTTSAARIENNGIVVAAGGDARVNHNGTIATASDGRGGIVVSSPTSASIVATGPVSTSGIGATGISATTSGGMANVTARDVTTTGNGAAGIIATGTSSSITINGRVSTSGTGALLAGTDMPGVPARGTPSNPGLDAADLQGPSVITFFDYFFSDNLGIPAEDFRNFIQWTVSGGSVDLVGGVGPGVFGAPPTCWVVRLRRS